MIMLYGTIHRTKNINSQGKAKYTPHKNKFVVILFLPHIELEYNCLIKCICGHCLCQPRLLCRMRHKTIKGTHPQLLSSLIMAQTVRIVYFHLLVCVYVLSPCWLMIFSADYQSFIVVIIIIILLIYFFF